MSFQAYLDNIKAKTGKTPADFKALAVKKGLLKPGVKAGEIVAWLKKDFALGHGHAMAIVAVLRHATSPKVGEDEKIAKHFAGKKSVWRTPYDSLLKNLKTFGDDVTISPTDTYLSVLRGTRKFAVIQITTGRMDIGIKLKAVKPTGRLGAAGAWNGMVTHRVQIGDPKQIDREVIAWIRQAYDASAGPGSRQARS